MVSFVLLPELLSCNGKGRARNTSSQQIDPAVWTSIKIMNISTNNVPSRTILLQYLAIIFFIFNKCHMDKMAQKDMVRKIISSEHPGCGSLALLLGNKKRTHICTDLCILLVLFWMGKCYG